MLKALLFSLTACFLNYKLHQAFSSFWVCCMCLVNYYIGITGYPITKSPCGFM